MKRFRLVVLFGLIALGAAACAPAIVVRNNTKFPVRAIVISSGRRDVLSPSPGESSATEVAEGRYTVAVIPDQQWIDYAKVKRKVLNDALKDSDKLSGPQLLALVQQLKEIAGQMQAFEQVATAKPGAACSGSISQDSGGVADVSQAADGSLSIICK